MKALLVILFIPFMAYGHLKNESHRPKSFTFPGGKAVFVDFTTAHYAITYDLTKKLAFIKASIKFRMPEDGSPVFDSVTTPTSIALNGKSVTATERSTPLNETTLRVLDLSVAQGNHTLEIDLPLATLVEFSETGVKSAFWTSDLKSRQFLERYMPANLEFDQVKMSFSVRFLGLKNRQMIYTNGVVQEKKRDEFNISYPSYFNSSSIFFHTVPEGSVDEMRFGLKSIDGREIPVVIYAARSLWGTQASNLERLRRETTSVFHELEADYGAWPHPSLVIYNAGLGGMEYHGATMTEFRALGHELFHSYFARGVMPANGNAGWLDEALASWRDGGYKTLSSLMGTSRMSAHPYYTRTTDTAAYTFGEKFMSLMDGKLKSKGGLKPFMRFMVEKKLFSPLFVEDFIHEMSNFYGVEVGPDFKRYTFGNSNTFESFQKSAESELIHRKMSIEELKNYL
jgi:hypothetical protein